MMRIWAGRWNAVECRRCSSSGFSGGRCRRVRTRCVFRAVMCVVDRVSCASVMCTRCFARVRCVLSFAVLVSMSDSRVGVDMIHTAPRSAVWAPPAPSTKMPNAPARNKVRCSRSAPALRLR